jgi:hypothetical protein
VLQLIRNAKPKTRACVDSDWLQLKKSISFESTRCGAVPLETMIPRLVLFYAELAMPVLGHPRRDAWAQERLGLASNRMVWFAFTVLAGSCHHCLYSNAMVLSQLYMCFGSTAVIRTREYFDRGHRE